MTYYQISALTNCTSSLLMGVIVYLRHFRNPLNRSFALFCLSVGLWSLGYFFWQLSTDVSSALLWCRFLMVGASFISPTFFHFVITLLELTKNPFYQRLMKAGYALAFFFLLTAFSPFFVKDITSNRFFELWPTPGLLYPLYLLLFFGYALYAWGLMLKRYRYFTGAKRNQIKYILLGTIIGYVGGSTNYPLWYNIPIPPIGNCLVAAYVVLIGYAIAKYRLLDIHFVIRKWLTNAAMILVMSAILAIAFTSVETISMKILFSIGIAGLFSIYLPRLKLKTENTVTQFFYKDKYKYQETLENFIDSMMLISKEDDLFKGAVGVLVRAFGLKKAAIFTFDHIINDYAIREQHGLDGLERTRWPAEEGVTRWLKTHRKIFVKEEMERLLSKDKMEGIRKELGPLEASVAIPIMMEVDLIGVITIGERASGEMYSHLDLDILKWMGLQLAVALNYKKMEEELRKGRELAAVGTMSAEMAHEIGNLLTPIKSFLQYATQQSRDEEFKNNSKMALDYVNAIQRKVEGMRLFSKDQQPQFQSGIDLREILVTVMRTLESEAKKEGVQILLDLKDALRITADRVLLQHVFHHILLNGVEAMKGKPGTILIKAGPHRMSTQKMKETSEEWVRIEVEDQGKGIPPEIYKKIFTPFVTTKSSGVGGTLEQKGMGLGLAVVKKIVNKHHGQVGIQSEVGKGTTVIIDLPVRQE